MPLNGARRAALSVTQSSVGLAIAGALVLLVVAIAAFTASGQGHAPDLDQISQLFVASWRDYIIPEPVERTAYLAGVLVAFPAALVGALVAIRMSGPGIKLALGATLAATIGVTVAFYEGSFLRYVLAGNPDGSAGAIPVPIVLQLAAALVLAAVVVEYSSGKALARGGPIVDAVLIGLAVLLASTRIRDADMLFGDVHFEAVFYSVTQVVAGGTLLADLPAQYGLYPEIIAPVLRLTGLSVTGFTLLMVFLQLVCLLALIGVLSIIIRTPLVRLLAGLTMLLFVGSTWLLRWVGPIGYEYYQLWPLRLLFPAIILLGFVLVHRAGMRLAPLSALAFVAGIGLVWNVDWGVPAYGALVACFVVRLLASGRDRRTQVIVQLAMVAATPVMVCLGFLAYLWIKSGGQIAVGDWLKYQSIFYASGFGMLPLPLNPHPWMVVVGVYLFGLVQGIVQRMRGGGDLQSDLMIVLAVLGIGIFTYYQGRSHPIVLTFVLWPAVLIAFMAADQTLRARRLGILHAGLAWGTIPTIAMGLLSAYALVAGLPRMSDIALTMMRNIRETAPTARQINTAFINEQVGDEGVAVILAWGQATLFAETGLRSAVGGPGTMELLLASDEASLMQTLLTTTQLHVFVEGKDGVIVDPYSRLAERYTIVSTSAAGLLHLQPRAEKP